MRSGLPARRIWKFISIERLPRRFGINVGDTQDVIETAIGGRTLTFTIEGRQRFPVRVRYARDFREDMEGSEMFWLPVRTARRFPCSKSADIGVVSGPFDDHERKRIAARNGTDECAGTRRRRICRGGKAGRRRARQHAAGILHRVERPV